MSGISLNYLPIHSQAPTSFWPTLVEEVADELDSFLFRERLAGDMHGNDKSGGEKHRS